MSRQKILAMVSVLLISWTSAGASGDSTARYGVVTGGEFSTQTTAALNDLGAGAVRMDFYWNLIQTDPNGSYNWPDSWVAGSGNRTILATLHGDQQSTPSWAQSCGISQCYPQDGPWYDFVYNAISHFSNSPNVVFGIWNEPNLSSFGGLTPGQYAHFFQLAASARTAANPNARLAGPETSSGATSYFNDTMSRIRPYMQPADVVTLHWYWDGPELGGEMNNAMLQAQGREVWLSETGYPGCDDAAQAQQLRSEMTVFASYLNSQWTKIFWFYFHATGNDCDEKLIRSDWSPRQAYFEYRDNWIRPAGGGGSSATILNGGQTINPGSSLSSPNGRFVLTYQNDGNLVLYDNGSAVWAINCWPECNDIGAAGYATIQTDGNFVVYNSSGGPVWNTGTNGNPGAYLSLGDDGSLVVYSAGGGVLWQR